MWGRLAPGVTAKMAEQELATLTNELRKQYPKDIWDNEYIQSSPGGHVQVMQPEMYSVAAMVGVLTLLILIVSCANLGALLLARAVTREREIGIRMAIGANRGRVFRQLCTESLMLAVLGSAAGLTLGWLVVQRDSAKNGGRSQMVYRDTGLAGPVVHDRHDGLRRCLFRIGARLCRLPGSKQRKTIARQILVGAQVAASCVLLIVAGLLVRASLHALYTDPGFGYEQLLSIDAGLGRHGYSARRSKGLPGADAESIAVGAGRAIGVAGETAAAGARGFARGPRD